MTKAEFDALFQEQIAVCENILCSKRGEYAQDAERDVLSNFNSAAGLIGTTPRKALSGMMLKHTVSIYDMCNEPTPREMSVWNEKITDHINYLILLKGCVFDELRGAT